jgi:plastocyanin
MMKFVRLYWLAALVLALAACGEELPTTAPPESELREQIHAATGHEPPACTDFTGGEAEIVITDEGFEPECALVTADGGLSVRNETDDEHTFTVSDPANNTVGRQIRVDEVLIQGAEVTLDPIAETLGSGIYPFWSKGHQEQGFTGSLIVGP